MVCADSEVIHLISLAGILVTTNHQLSELSANLATDFTGLFWMLGEMGEIGKIL
jgi:hypothetical protein